MKKKEKENGNQGKSKKNYLSKYAAIPTKGKINNSVMKALVDILGASLGAGISAAAGNRIGLGIGAILIGSSHYMDEKSGLLRITGSSAIAYAIAKALIEKNSVNGFKGLGQLAMAKERLSTFKDEVMVAFYLDKIFKKKDDQVKGVSGIEGGLEGEEMRKIDFSSLDMFDEINQREAEEFASKNDIQGVDSIDYPMDFAYSIIDENPDDE